MTLELGKMVQYKSAAALAYPSKHRQGHICFAMIICFSFV
jgi:hypothetical protein